MAQSSELPTRLVICIDGTWFTPDGNQGKGLGNITNIYRICASVKTGVCRDLRNQRLINQKKHYERGIGSAADVGSLARLKAGAWGVGYEKIIRDLYEECCTLSDRDEVWLYGFSRGAYIARAVAGLLDGVGILTSAKSPRFNEEYKEALRVYGSNLKDSRVGNGRVHSFLSIKTQRPPKIQFVGCFDTVKALDDGHLHNITFNDSIQHLRHALALNENREAMTPEYLYPDIRRIRSERSFVQAWFTGSHIDMGGSSAKDGLSLYPLQWMLLESQAKGLVVEFNHDFDGRLGSKIDDPLRVVFPETAVDGKGADTWSCTTKNGIEVWMQDLRGVHELQKYHRRYDVVLNVRTNMWPKKARQIFNDDQLRGYCTFAPQGTIIHPSVYQLLDENSKLCLHKKAWTSREQLESCRGDMLGIHGQDKLMDQGFWSNREGFEVDDVKALRILVCGNAGIGKSTLINRIFAVSEQDEVTESSARVRGVHRVQDPIMHKNRPNLIIHDSGGFEAGGLEELQAVEKFVRDRASRTEVEDRLHVIWFCVDMTSVRVVQRATEELFDTVSTYATDIPIIIVATKSDTFKANEFQVGRQIYAHLEPPEMIKAADDYATDQVNNRLNLIKQDLQKADRGRWDACVAVSKDDEESIRYLNNVTLDSFSHDKVRLVYVAAQTMDIDLKINTSIHQVMKIYKQVLGTASGLGLIPGAPTTNRTGAAYAICRCIVKSFGLESLDTRTIYNVIKTNVWDDLPHGLSIAIAEGLATVGLGASIVTFGMPFFLISGGLNIPIVVPATTRLMLMLATDLILILTRAYKKTAYHCVGQPLFKDVQESSMTYRKMSSQVHNEVLALVPRRNLAASFRSNKVKLGLERIIKEYKKRVADDFDANTISRIRVQSSDREVVKQQMEQDYEDLLPRYSEVERAAISNRYSLDKSDIELLQQVRLESKMDYEKAMMAA